PPQRGHVHRLVDEALAERAVAEPYARHRAAALPLLGERDADRIADRAAENPVRIEIAQMEMLAAAAAAADAVGTTEDLGEQGKHLAAIGEEMAMAAMVAEHAVARAVERGRDRDGGDLLADAGVSGAGDASARELIEQQQLEAADRGRDAIVIGER